jgi:Tfp pilus assembly protein PilF
VSSPQTQSPADSLNRLGIDFLLKGDAENAKLNFLSALRADPNWYPALGNLASLLSSQNELEISLILTRKLLAVEPKNGQQWSICGNVLTRLGRYDEALVALENARELIPDDRNVWHNLALLHYRMGDNETGLAYLQQVKDMGDVSAPVLNDEAHMWLSKGDLARGLEVYEIRWHHLMHLEPWDFHLKEWQGEDLHDKTLLFHAEQGFGDTIMCSRFASHLKTFGAKVTLGLPRSMCDLFMSQPWCDDVLAIEDMNEENMKFDYHSPMFSAMRHLEITRQGISPLPYITAPEIVVPKVSPRHFNVGICWASGLRGNEQDWRRRVTPLRLWLSLSEISNIQLYSLYKEFVSEDPDKAISAALVQDPMPKLKTWADTAAFVAQLDAVVTIDTAIGHLAGAMGIPCIMLSQFQPCWRWWDIDKGLGTPWYSSMSIISQDYPGEWELQLETAKLLIQQVQDLKKKARAA